MRRAARGLLLGLALLIAWSATSILLASPNRVHVQVGEPSPRNIMSPRRVVYMSEVKTEEARNAAVARVQDVYTPPDARVAAESLQALEEALSAIAAVRDDPLRDSERKVALIAAIPGLTLDPAVLPEILEFTAEEWQSVSQEAVRVLDLIMREEIREGEVAAHAQQAHRLARPGLSPFERDLMAALVASYVAPNSFLDVEATAAERQNARRAVEPVQWTIRAGESIVREGEILSPLALEKLEVLGLLDQEVRWKDIGGTVLLNLAMVVALGAYVTLCQPLLLERPRRELLLLLTLIVAGGAAWLALPGRVLVPYLFPAAAVSMLIAALLDVNMALFSSAIVAVLVGLNAGGSVELGAYALLGGIAGALAMARVDQIETFVRAAVYVALTNALVIVAFHLRYQVHDTLGLVQLLGMAVGNGLLSATLSFSAFALIGRLFGITTFVQLLELARPTHPLFHQLLVKAPGTYHHSIVVGNMAERAAQAVGADPLLARVGSYYHDVGKIARPYFFSENQADGDNPHDRLEPRTSAEVIIAHVRDGLALARRHALPERVCDFIPEHHGTTFAGYFYHQAKAQNPGEAALEEHYRYPGPKPQSKETAIVMLADCIEAAVRAKRPATRADTEQFVHKILTDRLIDGELDESELTMRDLETIRSAFLSVLQGVYHPRVDYPESFEPAEPVPATPPDGRTPADAETTA